MQIGIEQTADGAHKDHNRHSRFCEQRSRIDACGKVGRESNRKEQQEKEIDGAVLESRFASQFLLPESEPKLAFHVWCSPEIGGRVEGVSSYFCLFLNTYAASTLS